MTNRVFAQLRNFFLTGLVVFTPLVITLYVLRSAFEFLDGLLRPLEEMAFGQHVPGIGLLLALLTILVLGAVTTIAVGRKLVEIYEGVFMRIPFVRGIYGAIKDASSVLFTNKPSEFKTVVLVEYPRKGLYSVGFTTAPGMKKIEEKTKVRMVHVFMPHTPIPASGVLLVVPEDQIIPLEMSVEEGMKLIISGGLTGKRERR